MASCLRICLSICLMLLTITRAVSKCVLATILIICNCIENILKLTFKDLTGFEYLQPKSGHKSPFSRRFRSVESQTSEHFIYSRPRKHLLDGCTDVIAYNLGSSKRINITHLNKNGVAVCEEDIKEQQTPSTVSIDSTVNDYKIVGASRNSYLPQSTSAGFSLLEQNSEIAEKDVKDGSFDPVDYDGPAQVLASTSQEVVSDDSKNTNMESRNSYLPQSTSADFSLQEPMSEMVEKGVEDGSFDPVYYDGPAPVLASTSQEVASDDSKNTNMESRNSYLPQSTSADFSLLEPISEMVVKGVEDTCFDPVHYEGPVQVLEPTSQEMVSGCLENIYMEKPDHILIDDFNVKHSMNQRSQIQDKDRINTIAVDSNASHSLNSKLDEAALLDEVDTTEELKMVEKQLPIIVEKFNEKYSTLSVSSDGGNYRKTSDGTYTSSMEINLVGSAVDTEESSKALQLASTSESFTKRFMLFEASLDRDVPKDSDYIPDSSRSSPVIEGYSSKMVETEACSLQNLVTSDLTSNTVNQVFETFEESKEMEFSEEIEDLNVAEDANDENRKYLNKTRKIKPLLEENESKDSWAKIKVLDTLRSEDYESKREIMNRLEGLNDDEDSNLNKETGSDKTIPACGKEDRLTTEIPTDSFSRDIAKDKRNTFEIDSNCNDIYATEVDLESSKNEDVYEAAVVDDKVKILASDIQQKLCSSIPLFTEIKIDEGNTHGEEIEKVLHETLSELLPEETSTAENMDTATDIGNTLQSETDKMVKHVLTKQSNMCLRSEVSDVLDQTEVQSKKESTVAQKAKNQHKKNKKRKR